MAGNVQELTDANWQSEVLSSATPVLVDFWAAWCPPCRALAPTIEKLAGEYQGRVKVGKMDTDQYPEIPSNLRVSSLPTIILFQGGKEVARMVGLQPEAKFKDALNKLVG